MIQKLLKHTFFRAVIWIYIASSILSVGQYAFHLIMARMLGPQQFGVLESTISLLYIFSIPLLTITLVIVKYVSSYKGKNDLAAVHSIFLYFNKNIMLYGAVAIVILLLFSSFFVSFLHLPSQSIMVILIISFYIGLLVQLNRSVLQGLLHFSGITVTNTVETATKILFAVGFVYLGFEVNGALFAIALGGIVAYAVSFLFLKKLRTYKHGTFEKRKLFTFSLPVFLSSLSVTSLFTTDILLVRHYFPATEAGYYAAIALFGKVIYYGVSPIVQVMFPMISEAHAKAQKYTQYLLLSVCFTVLGAGIVATSYFLIPELMISLLFGHTYLSIAPYIGYFGIFMILYSLCSLLSSYFLSIHHTRQNVFLCIAAGLQIALIMQFHSTLLDVIFVSITVAFVLLVSLLLYYFYSVRSVQTT